jgi:hypothetical protein
MFIKYSSLSMSWNYQQDQKTIWVILKPGTEQSRASAEESSECEWEAMEVE